MNHLIVNGLVLPDLLTSMLQDGRWRHPGDRVLAAFLPWFEDPLDFVTTVDGMRGETANLVRLAAHDAETFRIRRGARAAGAARTRAAEAVDLPWLDVDRAVVIAVNRRAGDDVLLALDYRTGTAEPRVVAADVWTHPGGYEWRVVAASFADVVDALGVG